jgi:hypothetical protein
MTVSNKKNQVSGSVNPVVVAMASAVVAGVAVAGAMAMSNKDNQEKVKEVASTVVDKAKKLKTITKNAVKDVKQI